MRMPGGGRQEETMHSSRKGRLALPRPPPPHPRMSNNLISRINHFTMQQAFVRRPSHGRNRTRRKPGRSSLEMREEWLHQLRGITSGICKERVETKALVSPLSEEEQTRFQNADRADGIGPWVLPLIEVYTQARVYICLFIRVVYSCVCVCVFLYPFFSVIVLVGICVT